MLPAHGRAAANAVDYEAVLRDAGLRITKPRRIILEILHEAEGHPDATQIFERAVAMDSRISLATVYRTMKALEESGAIQRHAFGGGPARFEQAQARPPRPPDRPRHRRGDRVRLRPASRRCRRRSPRGSATRSSTTASSSTAARSRRGTDRRAARAPQRRGEAEQRERQPHRARRRRA